MALSPIKNIQPRVNDSRARSLCLLDNLSLLDVFKPTLWELDTTGTSLIGTALTNSDNEYLNASAGFIDGVTVSGSVWAIGNNGPLAQITNGVVTTVLATPKNTSYTGCVSVSGTVYALSYNGSMAINIADEIVGMPLPAPLPGPFDYTYSTPANGGFNTLCRGIAVSGTGAIVTLLPLETSIGIYDPITYGTSTITGTVNNPACFALNQNQSVSGSIAVGGWDNSYLAAYNAMAYSGSTSNNLVGVNTTLNELELLISNSRQWSVKSTVSVNTPTDVVYTPTGDQILVSSAASGAVSVYNYELESLVFTQQVQVSGASQLSVNPQNTLAFVCQPAYNSVTILSNVVNIWEYLQTLDVINPIAAGPINDSQWIITCASGFYYVNYINSAWQLSALQSLPYTPEGLYISGDVYITGTNTSGDGYISIISNGALYQASWFGSGNVVYYQSGQILVIDNNSGLFRFFSFVGGVITQQNTISTAGVVYTSITQATESLFLTNANNTAQYQFGAPYVINPTESGIVGVYNGSTWVTTVLGVSARPTAIIFDSNSNVLVATSNNLLYTISNGSVTQEIIIHQISSQAQIIPLGISKMRWGGLNNSELYATSCLAGGLLRLM